MKTEFENKLLTPEQALASMQDLPIQNFIGILLLNVLAYRNNYKGLEDITVWDLMDIPNTLNEETFENHQNSINMYIKKNGIFEGQLHFFKFKINLEHVKFTNLITDYQERFEYMLKIYKNLFKNEQLPGDNKMIVTFQL